MDRPVFKCFLPCQESSDTLRKPKFWNDVLNRKVYCTSVRLRGFKLVSVSGQSSADTLFESSPLWNLTAPFVIFDNDEVIVFEPPETHAVNCIKVAKGVELRGSSCKTGHHVESHLVQ